MCSPDALKLQAILAHDISKNGPMALDQFMGVVLGHPQYGYYMRQDPLGTRGDFTTAPEISQLFGEMIGLWLVNMWIQMGRPSPLILLEAGPGRGTLMADIMRVSKEFSAAAEIHLLEMSPALRQKQRESLMGYNVTWHDDLQSVPDNAPIFFIANEFFDALPFRQFRYNGSSGWAECMVQNVGHDAVLTQDAFECVWRDCGSFYPDKGLGLVSPMDGNILETAADRTDFMSALSRRMMVQGGSGLIFDYGHLVAAYGDTFQALHQHRSVKPLTHIGDADLTSHVDFSALATSVFEQGVAIAGMSSQGHFLNEMGITLRATRLAQNASEQQRIELEKALHRLTHSDEMGTLFKVMGIYSHATKLSPAGFRA